jgi:signal transduction histidine kinase
LLVEPPATARAGTSQRDVTTIGESRLNSTFNLNLGQSTRTMKRLALLFVLAVLLPSLLLAWLAIRSVRDQQFILERQQSLLFQNVADTLAKQAQEFLSGQQQAFSREVDALLTEKDSANLSRAFDDRIRERWPMAQVGFVVTTRGDLLAPSPQSRPEAKIFCADNSAFLANLQVAEVFVNNTASLENNPVQSAASQQRFQSEQAPAEQYRNSETDYGSRNVQSLKTAKRNVAPQQQISSTWFNKQVAGEEQVSKWAAAETEFRQLIGEEVEGTVARFVDDKLNVLLWYRPQKFSNYVFGAQIDLRRLASGLTPLVEQVAAPLANEVCLALLDDSAKPVALSHPKFTANWRRPFVATEIGETLPHWEMSVYLLNPAKLTQTAHMLKLTFGLLIALLVSAIAVGGWLIVKDLNRQLQLARQKTDFVSNVSHELKTPLTSIRMFSELLAEGRVTELAKQKSYLNIITAEASRLTRLINNVLDFARLERGEKKYNFQKCDLVEISREVVETLRPHLEESGFKFRWALPETPLCIDGDRDALAQVLVNLLSNAEKYSGDTKEIILESEMRDGVAALAEIRVCDRGLGVPRGCEQKIFEQFFRAHDSLASGIQGSGLGLTLCRQIARAHGGDVLFEPRPGGGSCFILRLPLKRETC